MMARCPACNARLKDASSCPRCKADLTTVINADKSAKMWLTKAIHFFMQHKLEQSISAISLSLSCKESRIAIVFREFMIHSQSEKILQLLAQKKLLAAKQLLYKARYLLPYSPQLQQLNNFCDYLLVRE